MYIVREIFHLQFGRYREAKTLIDEGMQAASLPILPGKATVSSLNYRMPL